MREGEREREGRKGHIGARKGRGRKAKRQGHGGGRIGRDEGEGRNAERREQGGGRRGGRVRLMITTEQQLHVSPCVPLRCVVTGLLHRIAPWLTIAAAWQLHSSSCVRSYGVTSPQLSMTGERVTGVGRRHTRWSHLHSPTLHEWLPLISDCMLIPCAQVFSAPGVSELMMIKMAVSEYALYTRP